MMSITMLLISLIYIEIVFFLLKLKKNRCLPRARNRHQLERISGAWARAVRRSHRAQRICIKCDGKGGVAVVYVE